VLGAVFSDPVATRQTVDAICAHVRSIGHDVAD
jgi:hypothetical protein